MNRLQYGYQVSSRWHNIRPAWLLALFILSGWIVGLVGDLINVCPPMVGFCGKATLFLAQDNGLVLYGHQYYQMFTSILVTDSVLDAGFNAIAVLIFDWLTEDSLNKTRYFAIFFGSALLGNLMTMLQGANYASAGASGGIFGLFAALVAFSSLKQRKIEAPPAILFIIVFFGSSILPDVNYVAHIGGAVGGFIAAGLMYDSVKPSITEYSFAYESKTISVAIVAGLILIACIASIVQFILFVWR